MPQNTPKFRRRLERAMPDFPRWELWLAENEVTANVPGLAADVPDQPHRHGSMLSELLPCRVGKVLPSSITTKHRGGPGRQTPGRALGPCQWAPAVLLASDPSTDLASGAAKRLPPTH